MRLLRLALPILALVALLVGACGGGGDRAQPATATQPGAAPAALSGGITVFAAASLTDAFNEMATAFKAANPGVNVRFNFAGTPTLRTQLEQGARADVFASADTVQMGNAVASGVVVDGGRVFTRNSLVIITPADANPKV